MVVYPSSNIVSGFTGIWSEFLSDPPGLESSDGYRDFVLHKEFPILEPFHLGFETSFADSPTWTMLTREYQYAAVIGAFAYVILVYGGQRVMKHRKPFEIRGLLFTWNLLLTVFSIISTLRLVPHVLYGFLMNDSSYFFCRNAISAYGIGPSGLWVNLFIWSKFVELIDTVFLVLRKKPVSFLHWFHHTTVLMYCWHASQYRMPTGVFFAAMNSIVHSIMYAYYTISAISRPPKWGMLVTVVQILQMFAGMFITAYHYYLLKTVPNCDGSYENLIAASVMYTAYMVLFVQFFISRYFGENGKKSQPSKRQTEKKRS